jgi:hypothetical protein
MTLSEKDFIEKTQEKMNFLVDRYGFEVPIVERTILYGTFTYKKNEIAIVGIWDVKEQAFEIKVALLDDNENVPDVYKMNDHGEIVIGYITEFLMTKGIRDFGGRAKKTGNLFDDIIACFLFLAENYTPELLKDGSAENFKGIQLKEDGRF